jgi:hypothetical protein
MLDGALHLTRLTASRVIDGTAGEADRRAAGGTSSG